MSRFMRWLVMGLVMAVLSGCGSSSGDTTKPVFSSSATATVAENQTSAITLKATDTNTVTYSIKDGDADSFAINVNTGVVTFKDAPDYETKKSYSFKATATDTAGNEATQDVTITISDVDDEAPVFTSSASASVAENQTSALTLVASDVDSAVVTYSISDDDNESFDIDPSSGVVTFETAPDFETKDTYSFKATATDTAGNEATQDVTIEITDLPESQLKKTGQTQIYDADGDTVDRNTADDNASLRDDGYYQTGVEPSYTRDDAKQIVIDHITGLEWQDDEDANTTRKQWLTDANYDTCDNNNSAPECYDTSGDTASTYCADLSLDGGGWRLPTVVELQSIVVDGAYNPSIDTTVFEYSTSSKYWSSTTHANITDYAWVVSFYYGYAYRGFKDLSRYVRCVRAGQ